MTPCTGYPSGRHTEGVNNIDRARRALEDADQRLETAVKDALAAGISVDDLTAALAEPSTTKN